MYFVGKLRWLEQEEQELFQEARKVIRADYEKRTREVRRLRRSWSLPDQLIANALEPSPVGVNTDDVFWGRIDISLDGKSIESRYIGYGYCEVDDTRILDWRAPLAEIFYSAGSLGKVSYRAPKGICSVTLTLRRRFRENALIVATEHLPLPCYQVDETPTQMDYDRGLADYIDEILSRFSDGFMRDIVKTIGAEQDKIIRTDSQSIMIVGMPGTGKTSVALHRLAYLNYRAREEQGKRTNRFVYIAPSRSLAGYSTGVFRNIPDTISDFLSIDQVLDDYIGKFADCLPATEKTEKNFYLETKFEYDERNLEMDISTRHAVRLIHSPQMLDALLPSLKNALSSLLIRKLRMLSPMRSEIKKCLDNLQTERERIKNINRWLSTQNDKIRSRKPRQRQLNALAQNYSKAIDLITLVDALLETDPISTVSIHIDQVLSIRKLIEDDARERKEIRRFIKDKPAIRDAFSRWEQETSNILLPDPFKDNVPVLRRLLNALDTFPLYREVWRDAELAALVERTAGSSFSKFIRELGSRIPNQLYFEEKSLFCLIFQQIFRTERALEQYDAVAVDEVQNLPYSALMHIRQQINPRANVILMSDPQQNIGSISSAVSDDRQLFGAEEYRLLRIYRSNPQILRAAFAIVDSSENVGIVRTKGIKPSVWRCSCEDLASQLHAIHENTGYTGIAVITKSRQEAIELGQITGLRVIREDTLTNTAGMFILPVSLCSGLEFDAVVIPRITDEKYSVDSYDDKRLLYVASTRAMHFLAYHLEPHATSSIVDKLIREGLVQ
ncbi:MAG: hypothetical protein ACUVV1_05605 [Fimbriimonadales bacterium]